MRRIELNSEYGRNELLGIEITSSAWRGSGETCRGLASGTLASEREFCVLTGTPGGTSSPCEKQHLC